MSTTLHNHNTLYHDVTDIKSHCIRMVIAFKGIQVDLIPVFEQLPEDLLSINPYASTPTWVDREIALYDWRIILEYLEERYPAPSLLPPVPGQRAQTRMLFTRMEKDWLTRIMQLNLREVAERRPIIQAISDGLASMAPSFEKTPYLMSETVTYADCLLLAILWRLPALEISLPQAALPLAKYAQRMFQETFFQKSLTAQERGLYKRSSEEKTA
jgi:RNA polymerase-associated protein